MRPTSMESKNNSAHRCDRRRQSDASASDGGGGGACAAIQVKSTNGVKFTVGTDNDDGDEEQQAKPKLSTLELSQFEHTMAQPQEDQQRQHQQQPQQQQQHGLIKATRKRYFILFMFVVLHTIKSFQWICLASVTNMVAKFYDVDNLAINWTTILFMVTFLVLALPISWFMDSLGLRRSLLIGSVGVTVGIIIKCFSCTRDGFAMSMLGHLVIGLAEPFFFSSYAQVASIWFPDHQVAMATAASLIGEQAGLALGFIIPPLMIGNYSTDFDAIQQGLERLFLAFTIISVLNSISIILFFDDRPPHAPGLARAKQIQGETERRRQSQTFAPPEVLASIEAIGGGGGRRFSRRMSQSLGEQMQLSGKFVTSKHFILLLVGFGINVGVAYSLHTLLNQMIIRPTLPLIMIDDELQANKTTIDDVHHMTRWNVEDANLIVGNAGLILIIAGLIGSALYGFVLDRYHRYKLTTASAYLLTLLSMAALTYSLLLENELLLYLVTVPLGFALTGYASCGFDYGVEITYPKPELLSSTLLNISAQIFGIPISLIGSLIVDNYGSQALGAFFCAVLTLGFIITCLQGGQLRRQDTVRQGELQRQRQQKQVEQLKRLQQGDGQVWTT